MGVPKSNLQGVFFYFLGRKNLFSPEEVKMATSRNGVSKHYFNPSSELIESIFDVAY